MSELTAGYTPNTDTAKLLAPDYGKRVIPDGRECPVLMMEFMCPICRVPIRLDAYSGPFTCMGHADPRGVFLEPAGKIWAKDDRGKQHKQ